MHCEKTEGQSGGGGYFTALCAAIFVAELLSRESICCRKKDGLGNVLRLLYCMCTAINGRSRIIRKRKWEIVPFPSNESQNGNRDWV